MSATMVCRHCGGSLLRSRTADRAIVSKCLSCSREGPVAILPEPSQSHTAFTSATDTGGSSNRPDWVQAARAQLTEILRAVRRVDEARAEAARIYDALVVYGITDLPALPWRLASPGAGARQKPGPKPGTYHLPEGELSFPRPCTRCQAELPTREAAQSVGGGRAMICRERRACSERVYAHTAA